jgi:hypothetical protein
VILARCFAGCAYLRWLRDLTAGRGLAAEAEAGDGKALVIAVTVPASRAEVWKAFSTQAGLSTWLAPDTTVDLKPGGTGWCIFQAAARAEGRL